MLKYFLHWSKSISHFPSKQLCALLCSSLVIPELHFCTSTSLHLFLSCTGLHSYLEWIYPCESVFLCCTQCCTMVFLWSCTKTVRNRKPCHCTSELAGQLNTLLAQFSRTFFEKKIEKRRTSAVQCWQKGTMYLRSMYLIQPYNSECPKKQKMKHKFRDAKGSGLD